MHEVIYYKFKKDFWAILWLAFDVAALAALFKCIYCFTPCLFMWQILTLIIIISAHLGLWLYKYVADNEMAVITDKDIKIDHTNPIAWEDIAYAEEKTIRCCFKNRKILCLVPHDGINYKYNWLQLHNAGFTAFSIPLYGIISKEDEAKIIKIVDKKVGIKTAKNQKEKVAKPAQKKNAVAKDVKKAPRKSTKKSTEKKK